jgi:hypothetical protein
MPTLATKVIMMFSINRFSHLQQGTSDQKTFISEENRGMKTDRKKKYN